MRATLTICGGFAALLAAAPAMAAPCGTAPLATYVTSGFSCEQGNFTFDSFSYSVSNGPMAADVSVVPDGSGFTFNGIWSATAGGQSDAGISYDTHAAAGVTITDASATIVGENSGAGSFFSDTESFDNGEHLSVGSDFPSNSASINFAGVSSLDVTKDNQAFAANGSAEISSVTDDVSTTPTMATVPAPEIGSGLATLAMLGALVGYHLFGRRGIL